MNRPVRVSEKQVCEELIWDLLCYEMCCGRLSPESKSLLQRHLMQCPRCHGKVQGFIQMLRDATMVRNYG
jgi:hypothetical protein